MKRNYEAPEAEIEMFKLKNDVCTESQVTPGGGNQGGDNPYEDDNF